MRLISFFWLTTAKMKIFDSSGVVIDRCLNKNTWKFDEWSLKDNVGEIF